MSDTIKRVKAWRWKCVICNRTGVGETKDIAARTLDQHLTLVHEYPELRGTHE